MDPYVLMGAIAGMQTGVGGDMSKQHEKRDIEYGPAPKHLVASIRKVLRELVEKKDLDQYLGEIGRFAMQADDLLMHVKSPEAVMKTEHGVTVPIAATSPMSGPETYGANIIRQIIPLLQQYQHAQKETPEALAYALVTARRAGMTDVSAELEKKLLGKSLDGKRPISGGPPMLGPVTVDDYIKNAAAQPVVLQPVASKKASKKNGAKVTT